MEVHLIDPTDYTFFSTPVNGPTGLLWVKELLEKADVETKIHFGTVAKMDSIITKVIARSRETEIIAGFSSYGELLSLLKRKGDQLKAANPSIYLIAGGPGFDSPDTARFFLGNSAFDAVNVGHASGIEEIVRKNGRINPPRGFYVKTRSGIIGEGRGSQSEFAEVPLALTRHHNSKYVKVFTGTTCQNRCDYCTSRNLKRVSLDAILRSIVREKRPYSIELGENISFSARYLEQTVALLEIIDKNNPYDFVTSYLDPSELINSTFFKRMLNVVRERRVHQLDIAFDAVPETNSFLGRRYLGKLRDKNRLREEIDAVGEFLYEIKKMKRRWNFQADFHYIFSPADSPKTILEMIDNLKGLGLRIFSPRISPLAAIFELRPDLGSRVTEIHSDLLTGSTPFNMEWDWGKSKIKRPKAIAGIGGFPYLGQLNDWENYFLKLAAIALEMTKDMKTGESYIPRKDRPYFREGLVRRRYYAYVLFREHCLTIDTGLSEIDKFQFMFGMANGHHECTDFNVKSLRDFRKYAKILLPNRKVYE